MITIEEAVKMQGTEFIYEFVNGNTIEAFVKKFDPKRGFSCWSFDLITDQGIEMDPLNKEEDEESACCLIVCDFAKNPEDLEYALKALTEIRDTGRYVAFATGAAGFWSGCSL